MWDNIFSIREFVTVLLEATLHLWGKHVAIWDRLKEIGMYTGNNSEVNSVRKHNYNCMLDGGIY